MTTEFKSITDRLNNNAEKPFIQLGDFHTENKKWISTLWFDTEDAKLRLQLPPCYTKAGIVDLSSKTYTDLLFDNTTEEVKELVNLFLTMENVAAKELHSKSDTLFTEGANMTQEEFEDMFTSTIRLLNRQTNVCIRVNIPTMGRNIKQTGVSYNKCDVYNKLGETRQLSDIRQDTQILPLIEISELRITTTNINLHVNLVECMILNNEPPKIAQGNRRIQLEGFSNIKEETNTTIETTENIENIENIEEKNEVVEVSGINDCQTNEEIQLNTNEIEEQSDEIETPDEIENKNKNVDDNLEEVDIVLENENKTETENEGIEDETKEVEDDNDGLLEISNFTVDEEEPIVLKKPDEVYKDIYKAAITKAKRLRQVALEAYLDAKKIKAKFMLKDIYDTDDDDGDEDFDEAELEELTDNQYS